MKTNLSVSRFIILVCLVAGFLTFLCPDNLQSQPSQYTFPELLEKGFRKGSAPEIAVFFRESLSVELPNQTGVYSKLQAEKMLHEFFLKNTVDGFTIRRSGNTGSTGNFFTIGELVCGSVRYRVYVVTINIKDKNFIHSLSITKI